MEGAASTPTVLEVAIDRTLSEKAQVERTQSVLKPLELKKPPLTEKLLSKPPFRYLHDLLSEIIRTTGFAAGLYNDTEMDSNNIKEKEAKINYLNKMIWLTWHATGIEIKARPSKIVAGLEPEETNIWLQILGAAVLKKVSTEEAVKSVLAGVDPGTNKKSRDKSARTIPKTIPEASEEAAAAAAAPSGGSSNNVQAGGQQQKQERPSTAGRPKTASRSGRSNSTREAANNGQNPFQTAQPTTPAATEPPATKTTPPAQLPPSDKKQTAAATPVDRGTPAPVTPITNPSTPPVLPPPSNGAIPDQVKQFSPESSFNGTITPNPQAQLPPSRGQPSEEQVEFDHEDRLASSTIGPLSMRKLERPTTARPAPPKIKEKSMIVDELPKAPIPVIIQDTQNSDEDEDECIVLEEESPQIRESKQQEVVEGTQHGGLVRKILETKKELGGKDATATLQPDKGDVSLSSKEKQAARKEIERLRETIQLLCRSSNPLGKAVDYIQEDVDTMNKELELWKSEARQYREQLQHEKELTEESLHPLQEELKVIEDHILEQYAKIHEVKAKIANNEDAIQKLITNVIKPVVLK